MAELYRYYPVGPLYLSLDQSFTSLIWLVVVRRKKLYLSSLGIGTRVAFGLVKEFLRCKFSTPISTKILFLPVHGNIGKVVHRGYKIFNLKNKTVFKMFSKDIGVERVVMETDAVRSAARLEFAPKFWSSNIKEGWYEEEYIRGRQAALGPSRSSQELEGLYFRSIAPRVERMLTIQDPKWIRLGQRVKEVQSEIFRIDGLEESLETPHGRQILDFLDRVVAWLKAEERFLVRLAFSHGDFSLVNMLERDGACRVIDWEDAKERSVFCDLYNWFFTELYYKRTTEDAIRTVSGKAIKRLDAHLIGFMSSKSGECPASADTYRKLFYLERIGVLLGRDLRSKNLMDVIIRSIKNFRHYEEAMCQDLN